ncbi:MAG: endoribonuclease MazF [Fibromonadaceae bacterium]|jgi:mRNA interferase MazF|nr:endoribonuclease MazF [Fibromonadaceae bacterium]
MVTKGYVPDKGDIVWLEFDPQLGHEQKGKRPVLVLSPLAYNKKVGLALFCPITSHSKGYPFEVKISSKNISGVVLSDQVKSFDWKSRKAKFAAKAKDSEISEVVEKIRTLIA